MNIKLAQDVVIFVILTTVAMLTAAANQDFSTTHGQIAGAVAILAVLAASLKNVPDFSRDVPPPAAAEPPKQTPAPPKRAAAAPATTTTATKPAGGLALLLFAGVALTLTACNPSQQELVSTLLPAVETAVPGITPILTDAQNFACQVQSDANTLPPSATQTKISTLAGLGCKW